MSDQLAADPPTFQLARPSQLQSSGLPDAQQPVLEQQLSQPEFSQGAYPPWMLQPANPAFCIPDSLGTQSPMQRDRHAAALPAVQPSIGLQQQEGQTRNAAALQELMTQADPYEPDPEDPDADNEMHDAALARNTVDDSLLEEAAQQMVQQADANSNVTPGQTEGVAKDTPKPSGLPAGTADRGRGAGTPAGPHEEFYSPPEHLQPDSMDYNERSIAQAPSGAAESARTRLPSAEAAKVTGAVDTNPAAESATALPSVSSAGQAAQVSVKASASAQAKTPMQASGPTKTPANGKHRLMSKRSATSTPVASCWLVHVVAQFELLLMSGM